MALKLGNSTVGSLYLGSHKVSEMYLGSHKVYSSGMPALAPKSMRFDFKYDHWDPVEELPAVSGMTWTHVSGDVYDFHCDWTNWTYQERDSASIFNHYVYSSGGKTNYFMNEHQFDVLDMDLTGVTSVAYLFQGAYQIQNIFSIRNTSSLTNTSNMFYHKRAIQITSVPLFDTSSVTDMSGMFRTCNKLASLPLFDTSSCTNMNNMLSGCSSLTSIPLFNTSSCTSMSYFASNCTKVETGALALYQQASTQATVVQYQQDAFFKCGSATTSGAAELAQIPTDWGGTQVSTPTFVQTTPSMTTTGVTAWPVFNGDSPTSVVVSFYSNTAGMLDVDFKTVDTSTSTENVYGYCALSDQSGSSNVQCSYDGNTGYYTLQLDVSAISSDLSTGSKTMKLDIHTRNGTWANLTMSSGNCGYWK